MLNVVCNSESKGKTDHKTHPSEELNGIVPLRVSPDGSKTQSDLFYRDGCVMSSVFSLIRRVQPRITVPVSPVSAPAAFSREQMIARRPGAERAKRSAARTLGSMEPGANSPAAA